MTTIAPTTDSRATLRAAATRAVNYHGADRPDVDLAEITDRVAAHVTSLPIPADVVDIARFYAFQADAAARLALGLPPRETAATAMARILRAERGQGGDAA